MITDIAHSISALLAVSLLASFTPLPAMSRARDCSSRALSPQSISKGVRRSPPSPRSLRRNMEHTSTYLSRSISDGRCTLRALHQGLALRNQVVSRYLPASWSRTSSAKGTPTTPGWDSGVWLGFDFAFRFKLRTTSLPPNSVLKTKDATTNRQPGRSRSSRVAQAPRTTRSMQQQPARSVTFSRRSLGEPTDGVACGPEHRKESEELSGVKGWWR
ncbi:hypothetical protein BKA70DRAFT_861164 [Coprinopsis sp. MPI-PUGE-AT-0042]|nr:hypothetical protein BKA70DRAFT_861164 [Coprinopsis sp. MPI-PUGE-AT-0042]